MRICVDGFYRDATKEETAELLLSQKKYEQMCVPDPTPTIEDRLAKVEEDSSIIRAILLGEETSE